MSPLRKKDGPRALAKAIDLALAPRALSPVRARSGALAAAAALVLACGAAGCTQTSAAPERDSTTATTTRPDPGSPHLAGGTSEPNRPTIEPSSEPTRLGGAVAVKVAASASGSAAPPPPPPIPPDPNPPRPPGKMAPPPVATHGAVF